MIIVVCGPSGAGKTTLVKALMARHPRLTFSISHTTRPPRGQERDGEDYFFVAADTFEAMVAEDAFAEHAQVHAHRYGTARATLQAIEAAGRDAVLDIDYQGARQIADGYPDAVTILVAPPSMAELEARLRLRATDSEAQVQIRLSIARHELSQYQAFRYLVVNEDVDDAVDGLEAIYLAEASRVSRQQAFLAELLGES